MVGSRVDIVEGDVIARVGGNDEAQVAGDQTTQVDGNRIDVVTGNSDERVSGMLVVRVEGKERRCVEENADLEYAEDLTVRVAGCMTTLVGKADKKRSWATHAEGTAKLSSLDSTEVISEGELILRIGKSSIRITEDKIELISAGITVNGAGAGISVDDAGMALSSKGNAQMIVEKKFTIMTKDGASLSMEKEVKIDGKKILLNSPDVAEDPPPKEPEPPTNVELMDETDGTPLAYQRFLVVMDDGSEVSGITDAEGKAEVDLASGGKVVFPELTLAGEVGAGGEMRPYVVRQGDYLIKLAFVHGFDAEEVWRDAKNDEIRGRRGAHNILAPGDIVYLPVKQKAGSPIVKGATNKYVALVPKVKIALILRDGDQIVADEPYVIEGLGAPVPGKSTPEGKVAFEVSVHVREIQLVLTRRDLAHTVLIGEMDPLDEASGVKKRLAHLGFLEWRPEEETRSSDVLSSEGPFDLVERLRRSGGIDDDELRRTIEAFQRDQGLKATGVMDAGTREALSAAHGS